MTKLDTSGLNDEDARNINELVKKIEEGLGLRGEDMNKEAETESQEPTIKEAYSPNCEREKSILKKAEECSLEDTYRESFKAAAQMVGELVKYYKTKLNMRDELVSILKSENVLLRKKVDLLGRSLEDHEESSEQLLVQTSLPKLFEEGGTLKGLKDSLDSAFLQGTPSIECLNDEIALRRRRNSRAMRGEGECRVMFQRHMRGEKKE